MSVCYFVTRPSSLLTLFCTVCVIGNFDVSILATTSKHDILHLNPLQTFPLQTGGERKTPKLLTKRDHLEALDDGSSRPTRLWGVVEGKADNEARQRERESIYQTMSWVPLCRQDGNYRAQTEKAWLGKKKSWDAQTAGLPPLGPQHNHNANQPMLQYSLWEEGSRSLHWDMVPKKRRPWVQTTGSR